MHERPGVPLVVQVGFAGSRVLLDQKAHPDVAAVAFHDAVQRHLTQRLGKLREDLGLTDRHFFCGLSQLAIGADTLFTRACVKSDWPQRYFLPQQRDDFLDAAGSNGTPDFTPAQREAARALFDSPHVIQERVVSDSRNRDARFQDVNLELVRLSDMLVCLLRAGAEVKPGGTGDLIAEGIRRGHPVLEIRVDIDADGKPTFDDVWHNQVRFTAPALPRELAGLQTTLTGIPTVAEYCRELKAFAGGTSEAKQSLFKRSALVIIGTHVIATVLAAIALQIHGTAALPWLLGGELVLLALGFATHQYLHRSHAVRVWAMARLVAEISYSVESLGNVTGYLSHLFSLPMPDTLRPLRRTLNVLHLRDTRTLAPESWETRRDDYVESRLTNAERGQAPYYEGKLSEAIRWQTLAHRAFLWGSGLAIAATLGELLLVFHYLPIADDLHDVTSGILGTLAIVLPVIAVAALSLAASFDLEARRHTYDEMLRFLKKQEGHLKQAGADRAFCTLALETEARLLGETANWYARRAFIGVA